MDVCSVVMFFRDTTREGMPKSHRSTHVQNELVDSIHSNAIWVMHIFHDFTLRHFNKSDHKVSCVHHVVVHSLLSIEQALDPLFGVGYLWDCWVCNCLSLATSHVQANQ